MRPLYPFFVVFLSGACLLDGEGLREKLSLSFGLRYCSLPLCRRKQGDGFVIILVLSTGFHEGQTFKDWPSDALR